MGGVLCQTALECVAGQPCGRCWWEKGLGLPWPARSESQALSYSSRPPGERCDPLLASLAHGADVCAGAEVNIAAGWRVVSSDAREPCLSRRA